MISDSEICSPVADKMGIKTTVHAIVAEKQNRSIPDPVTHADFLKCKCFNKFSIWASRLRNCSHGFRNAFLTRLVAVRSRVKKTRNTRQDKEL